MLKRLRSWWKNTSKTLDAVIILSLVILLVLLVLIILGYIYNWTWAGLHGKTLYDWLQLLIIPAVLAVGGYLFNYTTSRNEQKATQLRDQTERDVALDNQREQALRAYIDSMSELLLHENLRKSDVEDEVRKIARVRTLTVLPRLDGRRKASVLQFLYESGLTEKGKWIIDLSGADLHGADLVGTFLLSVNLQGTDLSGADLFEGGLSGADLSYAKLVEANLNQTYLDEAILVGADLTRANLIKADLRGAHLTEANLTGATVTTKQLDKATSLKGATMPDGTIHD